MIIEGRAKRSEEIVAKPAAKSRLSSSASGGYDVSLETILEAVRSIWSASDGRPDRECLRRQLAEEVGRLRQIAATGLQSSREQEPEQSSFFDPLIDNPARSKKAKKPSEISRFPEAALRVCTKDFADHALAVLPKAAQFRDLASYREYLAAHLPFNAVATRRRNANYIINRFFPGGVLFRDLTTFAVAAEGNPALSDVLFYLTCRSERIVSMVAESVVWPSLPDGGVARSRIADFVKQHFPAAKQAPEMSSSIVRVFTTYGVSKADRIRLSVALRRGCLSSFAYILHLECEEPGMFRFETLLDGPMHKWLLWDKPWIIQQLYLLRQAGLLVKVSEIDNLRQFTTKYPLEEVVDRIVPLLKDEQS